VTFRSGHERDAAFLYQWQIIVTNLVTVTNVVDGTNQVPRTNVVAWMNLVDGGNISGAATNKQRNQRHADHQQRADNQQRKLPGHRHELRRIGDQYIAGLTVTNVPPEIGTQPASQDERGGTTVKFAVIATGTPPLGLPMVGEWDELGENETIKNGPTISGATSNVLTIKNVQLTNGGSYTLSITNIAGSVTSSNAVRRAGVSGDRSATNPNQPGDGSGSDCGLFRQRHRTVPLHYQWWLNGTNLVKNGTIKNGPTISGATTNVLIIRNVQTNDSGSYTVSVTNIAGSVTSSNALLTVTV